MDLLRTNRRVIQQILSNVCEIPVRVSRRGDALVHLHHMDALPRQLFIGQCAQHYPRGSTAADGHHKLTAGSNCGTGFRGDELRGRSRRGFLIGKYFNLHLGLSQFPAEAECLRSSKSEFVPRDRGLMIIPLDRNFPFPLALLRYS